MMVIASLLLTAPLSAGLLCADPLRQMTFASPSHSAACAVLFVEPCESSCAGSHYALVFEHTQVPYMDSRINLHRSKNLCVLLQVSKEDMILCYCNTNMCSTNATVIKELWRKSPDYHLANSASKCIENAAENDALMSTVGDGLWCNYLKGDQINDAYAKVWSRDNQCVMSLFCDKDDMSPQGHDFYPSEWLPSYVSRNPYGLYNDKDDEYYDTYIQHCTTDGCTADYNIAQKTFTPSFRACTGRFFEDVKKSKSIPKEIRDAKYTSKVITPSPLWLHDDFYDVTSASEANHQNILPSTCVLICFVMFQIPRI